MTDSILNSVKKNLGLSEDYTPFDSDILMYINSTFADLTQIGVGPDEGFEIESAEETWDAFLGTDARRNRVKTYVTLKVRMLFDPPTTSYLINATEKMIQEAEWRINVHEDNLTWTPAPVTYNPPTL
jgi:hypothetical protein